MKLVFEDPSSWPVQQLPVQLPITQIAPTVENPANGIVVLVRPLDPLLNFWGPWKTAMLQWGVPKGGSIDVVTDTKAKTRVDWPIEIIDSLVKDVDGKVVEARITVLYFFLEYCCMAVVCGRHDQLAAERDNAIALLGSARPDWSGAGIAAISQLYA